MAKVTSENLIGKLINVSPAGDASKGTLYNAAITNLVDSIYNIDCTAATTLSGTSTEIPALIIPANSIILNFGVVVTSAITLASGTVGTKIGTAADGAQLSAAAAASIASSGTSVAAGIGTHTAAHVNNALQGNAQLVNVAGTAYRAAKTDVHFTITATGAISAGAVQCFVEYAKLT